LGWRRAVMHRGAQSDDDSGGRRSEDDYGADKCGSPGVGVAETMAGEYKKTMVGTRRSPGASAPVAMGARVS